MIFDSKNPAAGSQYGITSTTKKKPLTQVSPSNPKGMAATGVGGTTTLNGEKVYRDDMMFQAPSNPSSPASTGVGGTVTLNGETAYRDDTGLVFSGNPTTPSAGGTTTLNGEKVYRDDAALTPGEQKVYSPPSERMMTDGPGAGDSENFTMNGQPVARENVQAGDGSIYNAMSQGGNQVANYNAEDVVVNRDTDTVQGQLDAFLSRDNPILQRARTYAKQQMNSTGTLNSSMTDGAIFAAMIDKSLPIVSQDASTYYDSRVRNAGARNEAGRFNAGERNTTNRQELAHDQAIEQMDKNARDRIAEIEAQGDQTLRIQDDSQEFEGSQRGLDREHDLNLQENDNAWRSWQNEEDRDLQKWLIQEGFQNDRAMAALGFQYDSALSAQQNKERMAELVAAANAETKKILAGIAAEGEEARKNIGAQGDVNKNLQDDEQDWRSEEGDKDRDFAKWENEYRGKLERDLNEADNANRELLQQRDIAYNEKRDLLMSKMDLISMTQGERNMILNSLSGAFTAINSDPELTAEAKHQAMLNAIDAQMLLLDELNNKVGNPAEKELNDINEDVNAANQRDGALRVNKILTDNADLWSRGGWDPSVQTVANNMINEAKSYDMTFEQFMGEVAKVNPAQADAFSKILEPVWNGMKFGEAAWPQLDQQITDNSSVFETANADPTNADAVNAAVARIEDLISFSKENAITFNDFYNKISNSFTAIPEARRKQILQDMWGQ